MSDCTGCSAPTPVYRRRDPAFVNCGVFSLRVSEAIHCEARPRPTAGDKRFVRDKTANSGAGGALKLHWRLLLQSPTENDRPSTSVARIRLARLSVEERRKPTERYDTQPRGRLAKQSC